MSNVLNRLMPSLNWIGKEKIVNHDKDVPFRLLKKNKKYSLGKSENLILEGDNLEALKALMPFYYGKVKCIYIDPPYNTGNEKWIYNDKVNAPKIKEWFRKTVGAEGEDLTRHDKWLCMMYPRLKLLKDLLSQDGAIFISIDDNEQHHLRFIMDDIFGEENFITNIIWQKKYTQSNDAKYFSDTHDFIVAYAKSISSFKINPLKRTQEQNDRYKNPDNDPRGSWMTQPLHAKSGTDNFYSYTFQNGIIWKPPAGTFPRYSNSTLKQADLAGSIWFGKNGSAVPRMKKYLSEMKEGVVPRTIWLYDEVGSNDDAKRDIKNLFDDNPFESPKPVSLIKQIIELSSNKNDLILDSFAGSGTTGHAVLDLNSKDKGNRKFILVEMEDKVAKDITAERIRRVIKKNNYKSGFEYVELGEPLFNSDGSINPAVSFADMASYVYFTETRRNLEKRNIKKNYLGEFAGNHYFLLFDGIGRNVLDRKFLKELKAKNGRKVIYADKCLLDDEMLEKYQIVFKQIPYSVKVY